MGKRKETILPRNQNVNLVICHVKFTKSGTFLNKGFRIVSNGLPFTCFVRDKCIGNTMTNLSFLLLQKVIAIVEHL